MPPSLRLGEVVNPQFLRLSSGHSDASPGHIYAGLYQSPPGDLPVPEPLPGLPVAGHLPGDGHGQRAVLAAVLQWSSDLSLVLSPPDTLQTVRHCYHRVSVSVR